MRDNEGDFEAIARIYGLGWEWVSKVLPEGGSILTPGAMIWTLENLLELEDRFVGRPDVSTGKSFLTKLQEQLSDASPAAVQLMAELHLPFFWWVWEGAISASKKLADLNAILSWHPDRPTVPSEIAASMSPGMAHPGQWAMVWRNTQITSLIRVATALAKMPRERYEALLRDPFTFRDVVLEVSAPSGDTAKHGLLHLVFPDTFESITSLQQKRWIVERFVEYAESETDVDRALLLIRRELASNYGGEGFSFYSEESDPLVHLWLKKKAWKAMLRWLERIWTTVDLDETERNYKLPVAWELGKGRAAVASQEADWYETLQSGLSHRANNLLGWRHREGFERWAKANPHESAATLRALWDASGGRSESQRIDTFAEAIRPAGLTTTGAAVNLASVLLMAEEPELHPPLKVQMTRKFWKLAGWGDEPANSSAGHFVHRAYTFFV